MKTNPMKPLAIRSTFLAAIMIAAFGISMPAFGNDTDMLNKALDLVHQAWNPSGDTPSDDQRTDLLKQALQLAKDAPDHHLRNHRVKAILDIKAALSEIGRGDPDHKAVEYIHDADSELRTAISIAQ